METTTFTEVFDSESQFKTRVADLNQDNDTMIRFLRGKNLFLLSG